MLVELTFIPVSSLSSCTQDTRLEVELQAICHAVFKCFFFFFEFASDVHESALGAGGGYMTDAFLIQ